VEVEQPAAIPPAIPEAPEIVNAKPLADQAEPVDDFAVEVPELQPELVEPDPPASDFEMIEAGPVFTPMTQRPELTNRDEVIQALIREYPANLRDLGIGGQVVVWFII